MSFTLTILITCLALPMLSMIIGLSQRKSALIPMIGTALHGIALVCALILFFTFDFNDPKEYTFSWLYDLQPGLLLNSLTGLLLVIVTSVSFLVHLFSTAYMKHDDEVGKYFAFLGLFTFAMLGLVTANNLLQLFVCWELVGFSSYLLIGFWFTKDTAAQAARKAFIVNRVGDIGFLIAILIIHAEVGSLYFSALDPSTIEFNGWIMVAGFGLLVGAIGKSAQFPLLVWLPDAMEGPTPVSALIHAATMVAAGIFLLARSYFILDPMVLEVAAFVGVITATMAAFTALFQHDIKKVLAYSTISQLGYMLIGIGVGAPDMAMFHLTTHAFFKACLFLSAGSVIHALHHVHLEGQAFDPQDMRWMGGLRKHLPITFIAFVCSGMALAGLPLFSGFLSKDAIITRAVAWAGQQDGILYYIVPDLALLTALLTAIYIGRLLLLVFFGDLKLAKFGNVHLGKEELSITIPIGVLALLSIGFVFSLNPLDASHHYLTGMLAGLKASSETMLQKVHELHTIMALSSAAIAVGGLGIAYYFFKPGGQYHTNYTETYSIKNKLYQIIHANWQLDWVYDRLVVRPFDGLAQMIAWFDHKIVDGFVDLIGYGEVVGAHLVGMFDRHFIDGLVEFVASIAGWIGQITRRIQSSQVQMHFVWALVGLMVIIFWIKYF